MLRQTIEPYAPEESYQHPLFSEEAQAKLRSIMVSDLWLGLRAGIEAQREALLATPLNAAQGETLEARWGAIQQLSILLHGGPQMILQYSQLAASPKADETREYVPKVHKFEG